MCLKWKCIFYSLADPGGNSRPRTYDFLCPNPQFSSLLSLAQLAILFETIVIIIELWPKHAKVTYTATVNSFTHFLLSTFWLLLFLTRVNKIICLHRQKSNKNIYKQKRTQTLTNPNNMFWFLTHVIMPLSSINHTTSSTHLSRVKSRIRLIGSEIEGRHLRIR